MENQNSNKKSGFAVTSLVLGIISLVFSFVPFINYVSYVLGILSVIFGIVALATKQRLGLSIAGFVTGFLSLVIAIYMTVVAINAVGAIKDVVPEINKSLNNLDGSNTSEILENNVNVVFGEFNVKNDSFITNTSLPVTVKNISDEKKSFMIQIEAVNSDGSRIADDTIYVSDLNSNQSQKFEAFTLVSSDKVDALKKATFKVLEVSMY